MSWNLKPFHTFLHNYQNILWIGLLLLKIQWPATLEFDWMEFETDLCKKPSHVTHINQLLQLFEMIENKSCCAKQQKTW